MSQSGTLNTSGGGGGGVDELDGNTGAATPTSGVINILGDDSTTNNANGIYTGASGSDVTVYLSNRVQGIGSTSGAVTADLITFSCGGSAAVFTFTVNVAGFESSTPAGCGYTITGSVITDGVSATLIGTPDKIVNEDAAISAADCNLIISGNNAIIRATGVAALDLSWSAVGYYVEVT